MLIKANESKLLFFTINKACMHILLFHGGSDEVTLFQPPAQVHVKHTGVKWYVSWNCGILNMVFDKIGDS